MSRYRFESDVILYSDKTCSKMEDAIFPFESDVILYSDKTILTNITKKYKFESDVIWVYVKKSVNLGCIIFSVGEIKNSLPTLNFLQKIGTHIKSRV